MAKDQFGALPEDLTSLSDDELQGLLDEKAALYDELRNGELTDERVAELETVAADLSKLDDERNRRVTAAEELTNKLADMDAKVATLRTQPEVEETAEPEAVEDVVEPEVVAATADATELAEDGEATDAEARNPFKRDKKEQEVVVEPEADEPKKAAPKKKETKSEDEAEAPAEVESEEEATEEVPETKEPEVTSESESEVTTEQEPSAAAPAPLSEVAQSAPAPVGIAASSHTTVTASADIPGIPAGAELGDMKAVAEVFATRLRAYRGSPNGGASVVPVASFKGQYSDEFKLKTGDKEGNTRKIRDREALTASGGICAPAEPYYAVAQVAAAHRPARDGLRRFQADRGRIAFLPGVSIADIGITGGSPDQAIAIVCDDDVDKPYQQIGCPGVQTAEVCGIPSRLRVGNLQQMTDPEYVEAVLGAAMAQHARVSESAVLDGLKADSTQVTTAAFPVGVARSLFYILGLAASGYRGRNRLPKESRLDVFLPEFLVSAIAIDVEMSGYTALGHVGGNIDMTRASIEDRLDALNLNVTWYVDSPTTGVAQVTGPEVTATALNPFPASAQWGMWHEGAHLFLETDTLELGFYRDSILNTTNDVETFTETFETTAFIGVESIWGESPVCVTGVASDFDAAAVCP